MPFEQSPHPALFLFVVSLFSVVVLVGIYALFLAVTGLTSKTKDTELRPLKYEWTLYIGKARLFSSEEDAIAASCLMNVSSSCVCDIEAYNGHYVVGAYVGTSNKRKALYDNGAVGYLA